MTIHNIHPGTEEEEGHYKFARKERAEISLDVTRFFLFTIDRPFFLHFSWCVKHIVELLVWPSRWNVDFDLQIS